MRTKAEQVEESIRFRRKQVQGLLHLIGYNCDMIIQAETLLEGLYEEAQIAGVVKLCLTGK